MEKPKIKPKKEKKSGLKYTDEGYRIYTEEELNLGNGNYVNQEEEILQIVHLIATVVSEFFSFNIHQSLNFFLNCSIH